jgi:hypothetical protein
MPLDRVTLGHNAASPLQVYSMWTESAVLLAVDSF